MSSSVRSLWPTSEGDLTSEVSLDFPFLLFTSETAQPGVPRSPPQQVYRLSRQPASVQQTQTHVLTHLYNASVNVLFV